MIQKDYPHHLIPLIACFQQAIEQLSKYVWFGATLYLHPYRNFGCQQTKRLCLCPPATVRYHAQKDGVVMAETGQITSGLLWRAALITALIDIARRVSFELFCRLKWHLAGVAFIVYAALWGTFGSLYFWGSVYQAIFPAWSRWLLPLGFGLLYGGLALAFWRVSILTGRWQVAWFILLGGLMSLVGHGIGISRGLFRVPLLAQANVESALVFGVFEFIFYWCAMVGLSLVGRWFSLKLLQMR